MKTASSTRSISSHSSTPSTRAANKNRSWPDTRSVRNSSVHTPDRRPTASVFYCAGNVLAAGFSTPAGIYEYDNAGNQVNYIAVSGTRGARELGNGNIMFTNSAGVNVYDIGSGVTTNIIGGSGQFIGVLVIPVPGSVLLLGLAGVAIRRCR